MLWCGTLNKQKKMFLSVFQNFPLVELQKIVVCYGLVIRLTARSLRGGIILTRKFFIKPSQLRLTTDETPPQAIKRQKLHLYLGNRSFQMHPFINYKI